MIHRSPENIEVNVEVLDRCHDSRLECPIKMFCLCPNKYNSYYNCKLIQSLKDNDLVQVTKIIRQEMGDFITYSRDHH